ncbi:hypothetical protein OROHE_009963 [Orobanche hederae]
MEVEKRGVKGGFFQLFDWNSKSRKRLFSSKAASHENSNQGKENLHGSALAQVLQESDNGFAPNDKGQNHYHYASSLSADAEYRTKPPGVVARLMGLDSLPTSNVNESSLNPFTESPSFGDSSYIRYPPTLQREEHDIVIFQSVRNKLDGLSKNPLDLRLQKAHNRPIEKFQTEVLPPKSSKPISVTQHRLLSPIKSPRFIPSKNAAYIFEAAAKIMEQSPRANVKSRLFSLGSSYVPLKIHDLKEKMESAEKSSMSAADASQRYKEHKLIKNMKKQHSAESRIQSADCVLNKGIEESERVGSQRLRSKEKSVSLAVEAKPSFQKRDGSTSVDNRSSAKQKEYTDIKNSCVNRKRSTAQKTLEKRSSSRKPSEVLRLNNQKQNWAFNKETEIFEPSSSHSRDKKVSSASTNYITGEASRTVNKIVVNSVATSRKTNLVAADPGKELSSSRAKPTSKKKLPIKRNTQSDGSVAQEPLMMKYERGDCEWDKGENKNNLDVVSFTFTSPIKKSGGGSNSCGTISKMSSRSLFPNCDPLHESESPDSSVPSSEFNVVRGDSLSVLLETKLQELTSRIELSQQGHPEEGSFSCSTNCYGDLCPTVSLSGQEIQDGSHSPSINKSGIKSGKDYEGLEHIEERYNHLQGPCSVSNQLSLSDARGEPLDVDKRLSNVHCLSPELNEDINWFSSRKSYAAGGNVEISDTASSFSAPSLCPLDSNDPSCWGLQYIEYIIYSAELLFEEFALGLTYKIIPPDFFHHLENQQTESNKITVMGERFKIEHKVLFDCVGECLEVKCGRLLAGSKMWAKQTTHFNERQWLVEEVYREISRWINSDELMVDEIVDKDMSCKNGQWVDFEIEAFEEGVEIENRILSYLVDELVDDFVF